MTVAESERRFLQDPSRLPVPQDFGRSATHVLRKELLPLNSFSANLLTIRCTRGF